MKTGWRMGAVLTALAAAVYPIARPAPEPPAGWYAGEWRYRQRITIHHRKVSGRLSNFPVLIAIDGADLRGASPAGTDLLFTAADGVAKLNYERVRFSQKDGLIAWVQVPTLSPVEDTAIYLYYGNENASDQQNAAGAWDSNYLIVAHFADVPLRMAKDSTSNQNDGAFRGADIRAAAGQIDSGAVVSDRHSVIEFAGSGSISNLTQLTWEMWFKPDAENFGYLGIQSDANRNANANTVRFLDRVLSYRRVWSGRTEVWRGNTMVDLDLWSSVAVTYDGSSPLNVPSIYLNGISDGASCTTSFGGVCPPGGALSFPSGVLQVGGSTGIYDEFRYSKIARSGDWIRTEYENQASPRSFYTVEAQEVIPVRSR